MNIAIAIQQFSDHSQYFLNHSKCSIRRTRQEVGHYTTWANIDDLRQVSEENVRAYFLEGMVKNKWQPTTFCAKHITLKVFFQWCIQQNYMSFNPMNAIQRPKREKKIRPKLTKNQALRLLDIVYHLPYRHRFPRYRNHAIFSVFLFAGLRRSELFNLKYADVDVDNLSIFVRCGKGKKDRIIPISYTLANTLKTYIAERAKLKTLCPDFFVTRTGKQKMQVTSFLCIYRKVKAVSGIEFSPHTLRHTFATLMLEGGCDIYSLSKMMGHSDIETTTIYLAASAHHLRSEMMKHPLNSLVRA